MAKKKSASVQRGQVKLREKKLKDGSSSLYLDINVGGKRHKEYLKLQLPHRKENRTVRLLQQPMP